MRVRTTAKRLLDFVVGFEIAVVESGCGSEVVAVVAVEMKVLRRLSLLRDTKLASSKKEMYYNRGGAGAGGAVCWRAGDRTVYVGAGGESDWFAEAARRGAKGVARIRKLKQ